MPASPDVGLVVREFRDQTNCGLKDAKDAVEAMEREMAGPPS